MKNSLLFLIVFFSAITLSYTQKTTWALDKDHSKIGFEAPHMLITTVDGKFTEYSANIKADKEDFTDAQIEITIQAKSIDTGNEKRDNHLRSGDFFDVEKYPTITFTGKSLKKVKDKQYKLTGDLTIKGVTKAVTLDVKHGGTIQDPYGNTRAGFKITGTINRFDYGVDWSAAMENGSLIVGKEIDFDISVELTKQ